MSLTQSYFQFVYDLLIITPEYQNRIRIHLKFRLTLWEKWGDAQILLWHQPSFKMPKKSLIMVQQPMFLSVTNPNDWPPFIVRAKEEAGHQIYRVVINEFWHLITGISSWPSLQTSQDLSTVGMKSLKVQQSSIQAGILVIHTGTEFDSGRDLLSILYCSRAEVKCSSGLGLVPIYKNLMFDCMLLLLLLLPRVVANRSLTGFGFYEGLR